MQCPHCGSTALCLGWKFCPQCGSLLSRASSIPTVAGHKPKADQSVPETKTHSGEVENQKKVHSTKTDESQPMTSQTPGENHNQKEPTLSTNIGQEESPLNSRNQRTCFDDEFETSRIDESFTKQSQEQSLPSQNQGTGKDGNKNQLENTSPGQSLPSPNRIAGKDGKEIPPTNTSQGQPMPSPNQGAGEDDEEIPPTNTSQGQSLPSPNQIAGKDGKEIPPTNTSQEQSLPSPNQGAGEDGEEIPPTNTSQGQSLPSPNQIAGEDGKEIPPTNTSQGQSLPSPNQGAGEDDGEIPPTNTSQGQSLPSPNQIAGKDGEEIPPTNTSQEQSLPSLNQIAGEDGEEIPPTNTSQEQSLPSLNQGAGEDDGEIPPTNTSQGQSLSSPNQIAGKDGEEIPPTNTSQGQSLPSLNQIAGEDGEEIPPTNTSQEQSLPSPNQGAGEDGEEIPPTNTSQGQSLPSPNQIAGEDGEEIPPTNTSQGQSLPSPNQGAGEDGEEIPPTNTSQGQKKKTLQVTITSFGPVTRKASQRNQSSNVSSSTESSGGTAMTNKSSSHTLEENGNSGQSQEMVGTQSKSLSVRSGSQQEEKTQHTPSTNDKNSEKKQSALQQSLLAGVAPESGVTVVFHVLLVSNFNMKEGNLFIRAHGEDLGNFQLNCVDMVAAENIKSKGVDKPVLYRGQVTLSVDRARRRTKYKYLVVKKGTICWENLPQFVSYYFGGIVNRVLKIPEPYVKPGETWNQFDGVTFVVGNEEGLVARFRGAVQSWFSRDKTSEYLEMAVLRSLPRWKGFSVDGEEIEEMTATEAIEKLESVLYCLSHVVIEEFGFYHKFEFSFQKTLSENLRSKMETNVRGLAKSKVGSGCHVSAVVSSLAIAVLVHRFTILLSSEEVLSLLSCLALEVDPSGESCTVYEEVLREFSPDFRVYAASAIESLCNKIIGQAWSASYYEWLWAVPLLHFLRGDSRPFEEPEMDGNSDAPAWWGAEKLKVSKEKLKVQKCDFVPHLASAFEVDRLLRRTVLFVIPVGQLDEVAFTGLFPVSDLCVALMTFLPHGRVSKEKLKTIERCVQAMVNIMENEKGSNRNYMSHSTANIEHFTQPQEEITGFTMSSCLKLAVMLTEKNSFRDHTELICLSIKLFLISIHKWEIDQEKITEETERQTEFAIGQLLQKLQLKFAHEFRWEISYHIQGQRLTKQLQVWSKLLSVADGCRAGEIYRSHLGKQFEDQAAKMQEIDLCEMFCDVNLDQHDKVIGESLTKLAFKAVEKIINSREREDTDRAFKTLSQGSTLSKRTEKCGELLSILLAKSWPENPREDILPGLDPVTVEFLLSWNPMAGYFRFFGDESGRGRILTPDGEAALFLAKSLLAALVKSISDASITVVILELLHKYKDRFLQLLDADSSLHNMQAARETERSLNERIREIQEFQELKTKVSNFIRMCEIIPPVNVTAIKKNVEIDVSLFEIGNLCQRNDDNSVEINFFDLPPEISEVLYPLYKVQESSTFQELWEQYGKRAQTSRKNDETQPKELSIFKVLESVWKHAYEDWEQIAVSTLDGSINLGNVDKFFGGYKDKKQDLETELFCIFNLHRSHSITSGQLKTMAKKRAEQMQLYQQIHQYANAAETIWDFKQAMGFSGDFTVVEDLRNQLSAEFKGKCLKTIGHELTEAGRALERLNVDKAQCLKKVVESNRLVEWLRTTIASTQELKVLVDLALISAGESDIETDRISNLHTSCLGFAPLIFELKETERHKVDFAQLMKACESVWKAVEVDRRLPQKLLDTSRHLEWLKTVKESHGSVAMTSLVQAEMINSSGVYVVGRLNCEQDSGSEKGERLSLDHVVCLTVPPKKSEGENAQDVLYSLDEIKDLQSKLMLIAGKAEKGKDEVDTFVQNLEGITRLAKAYINLSESGFVHRMDWSQEFRCSRDQVEGESISEELARVSTAMEDCLSKWKQKISDARKEYRELNFFNTQQLMLLRKEIARACHRSPFEVGNPQVFTLLESVRPGLYTEHLMEAVQRAFEGTNLLEQAKDSTGIISSFSPSPRHVESVSQESLYRNNNCMPLTLGLRADLQSAPVEKPTPKGLSKIQCFLNTAENEGYSEQVALCALASLGVEAEEDDLLLWCLDESDDADLESLYAEAINNPAIAREMLSEEIALDQGNKLERSSESVDELKSGSYDLPQSSTGQKESGYEDEEQRISEYLTLLQLGLILRELAFKGKESRPRLFPAFLRRGRPNLMLVPKGDVLATVLALYMHDEDQPLPSQEEVLICTPGTTTEEIELLWRRAIGDLEGRFYCLVNADELDFSVSKEAVDRLDELTKGLAGKSGENYGLVVLCSSESEDRANIVAALDQHRVAAPACPSRKAVQSYLKKQFRISPYQYGYINKSKITWNPAGSLDPEKLCVRVVSSIRGGLGKTLFVRRLTDQLPNLVNNDMVLSHSPNTSLHVTVPLHGNSTDSSMLVNSLLPHGFKENVPLSRVFHLDVAPSVRRGLDTLLFNLLVLGSLCDKMGRLWRRRTSDLYIIEITTNAPLPTGFSRQEQAKNQEVRQFRRQSGRSKISKKPFYDLLPTISCASPRKVSRCLLAKRDPNDFNPRLDIKEFQSPHFQRVYQYLKLSQQGVNLDNFTFMPAKIDKDQKTCLSLLLRNCGIPDPSWSEIRHFVSFLNSQLRDCEQSVFCNMKLMREILKGPNVLNLEGFRSFVVRFMIQMSRDFATPSLTDENAVFCTKDDVDLERQEIEQFQLRRRWESSPHPYLFFNEDHITMTFLGFSINSNGDLVDPQASTILDRGLMPKRLTNGLRAQGVDFTVKSESWSKAEKIQKLCSVLGAQWINTNSNFDPDRTYELTMDNVKKIMAIQMRFRCNIPVIVMGETGCGKTRLIRFMCGLQAGPNGPRNMLLVKVHGGTTYEDIEAKVKQAEGMAKENQGKNIDTVLFFDEANTTEALSMIKEVMVDRRIRGRRIGLGLERLQFIAACNPYRRHTDDMIHKLECAGLGYHVKTEDSDDRLGHIPLRHLVYRVHALPGSMRPLIWDFGQLNHQVETLYTNQIVSRYILHERKLSGDVSTVQAIASVLAAAQKYMRDQLDECSFVSLRDVERAMQVMVWFYNHVDILGKLMTKVLIEQRRQEGYDVIEDDGDVDEQEAINPVTRALVLAIGVCYHAKLQERRQDFRKVVAQSFKAPCQLPGGEKQIHREITSCQRAVLNELELGPNIAPNTALSENVFMMVVCIELRIPLFVVGKPGSSKSLAKTVVADNMQGDAARSELFKAFKQVHMASYQCSPLSTPDGIVGTFRQCRKLQEGKNLDRFVSVVVLDEVGLAEDSPLMPLKTLHPLLEDGVTSSDDVIETDEKPQRVAFVGISNWALDPAKMNRGIMLSRGVPDEQELVDSALGICSTDKRIKNLIKPLIAPLANGYAKLYKEQKNFETLKECGKEEFFGLRDYYSLIKMVYAIAAKSGQKPSWYQLEHAIRRNFGGLTERKPVDIFKRQFQESADDQDVECSTTIRLIEASLAREDVADQANFSENRYLLILTENYAALRIMQQQLLKKSDNAIVIFGSSFPNDQEYTQVCRNINRIKVCMETGRTVILLNLESLYESLYDALNQYYVYLGGQKYVDLGLGTHRVKCRVHDDFKLIVIAEKDVVYNKYPIPLINRLEKHFLVTSTSLTADQNELVKKLKNWVNAFAKVTGRSRVFSVGDAFVGFHEDTISSVVIQVYNDLEEEEKEDVSQDGTKDSWKSEMVWRCKSLLLEMASPDAIARLPASGIEAEAEEIWKIYFNEQQHSSLAAFMSHVLQYDDCHLEKKRKEGLLVQITTHSRLLSKNDLFVLCDQTDFSPSTVDFMTLQQFQTEQQFRSLVRLFFERNGGGCSGILIVQCDSGDDNFNLIAGARHILMEERNYAPELLGLSKIEPIHIALVVQLPRIPGGCRNFVGFQGGQWMSVHLDELRPPGRNTPSIDHLINRPISELFGDGNETQLLAVNLLRNCVQAAACRIDNEGGTLDRSTQRIELLLQLLPEDFEESEDKMTFASVLVQRTYHLLKESESKAYNADEWLYWEALSGTGVQEWGTFRKAIWKRVYSSVVPILAEIIALADTDSNLDLMKDGSPWVSTLWLRTLANPNISELSYSKMISPVTNSVRERVQVLGSGAGGHTFQCKFPFSFLVKHQVDKLLDTASSVAATSSATLVKSLRDLIANSETGLLFDGLQHDFSHLAAFTYLSDYVHMVYTPSDKSELEIVFWAVLSSARELEAEIDDDGNELLDIALIHVAHSRIQSRLRCFAKLVQAQPTVVQKLTKILNDKESEVLLDVVALSISLEELQPSDEILLDLGSAREWCDKVLSIRQAVEVMMSTERFQVNTEMNAYYGDKAKMRIGRCRSMWQREGAVRLFVEHVTFFSEQSCCESVLGLWKVLDEETDFSSLRSLQIIEKFLISYSQEAQKRGDESDIRRRCNAFFMELVALFCFGESSKDLQEDALSHLMQYVVVQHSTQTKDFSPFPDFQIDPTPVVRSFLLQQLLRSSQSFVKNYLDVFLREAQSLQRNPQHIKEVCFLCVQCIEDNLISRYQAKSPDTKLTVQLKQATKICNEVSVTLEAVASFGDEPFDMNANALESVAKGRHVLTRVADYLYKFFIKGDSSISGDHDAKREFASLLEAVKRLCPESPSPSTPHMFLLRQLVRCYGFDCVRNLGRYQELQWIVPPDARRREEDVIQDRFVVHLKPYRDIRELVAKGVISGNIEDFAAAVTEVEVESVYKDALLLLALYREVTCSQPRSVSHEVQPFAKQLLQTRQGGNFRDLEAFPGKSAQDHTLAEIVIHTSIALQCIGSGSLTGPLYVLMTDPSSMANSYLPTMPDDSFLDCIKVIAEVIARNGEQRPGEWYECGNCKHPYFIGECSQPMEKTQCPDCGGVLGGEQHKFLGEYGVAERQDRTKTGHVLGEPGSRPTNAEPQRNLSPILCSLLRILMHASMVMGACKNAQATVQVIKPRCEPCDAAELLWRHLQRDLDVLGRALGRSVDDAALTVHLVLYRMISLNGGETENAHNMRLVTKESRLSWETDFSSVVIAPVIRQLDQNLQKASKLLMEDERFGSDPLVRRLYEFEEQQEDPSLNLNPTTRSLWKYRRQVTVEHLGNGFQQADESFDNSRYKILRAFLKQEHKLRCVQFLPDIVRLQRLLMDRFHRRIDRTDAEKFTIQQFLKSLPRGPVKDEFSKLIQRFKLAWNSCRSFLGEQGRLRVPQDLLNIAMDNNCSIAMLLPSTKGMNVCSTALLYFLVNTHDEFLGIYRSATNQDSPLERISMSEVTMSQLIAYDPERDLLPLILAHCNYSLKVGQETLVQYDWTALERQLTDRFLKGRPFVEFKEERFAFSRDTRDDSVFASLAEKIPQDSISRAIEGQIISDLRSSLSEVCDVLSSLDIAIGFLSSSGGQTGMPLKWYLHEVLKLPRERGLRSPTAEQYCNLSHTLALWRLMALEKAKIKSRNKQEPFEEMPEFLKGKLSPTDAAHLNRVLRKIDIERLLPFLLEMILLNVKHAKENIAEMSFLEYLDLYLAQKKVDQIPGMEKIPSAIHMKHLQAVWNSAVLLCVDSRSGSQYSAT
ncbi:E3 ubiquitin-protein ligase rnf213-alpha-like isoform X4 [Montipora capricornis]|uniref:E3 ubiquitin-protein ligase rnf213-alpha-like isoform X4 n=1 Tax=Montipora capricornis TaxID=246305 RepID=UPI0035F1DCFD